MKHDAIRQNEKDASTLNSLVQENAELKKELQRLSFVIDGTKAGFWDWDIQNDNVTVNRFWAEMLGYTLEEIGHIDLLKWKGLCHPEDLNRASGLLENNVTGKANTFEAEIRMRHKNGNWVWILTRAKVFERNREGTATRMTGSHQDITVRKHAEDKIRQERNLFLEGPVTVFRWQNTDGYPAWYVSPNVTTLTGYAPSDFTSGLIVYDDIIHPDDLDRALNEMKSVFANPESTSFEQEYRLVCKNGSIIWIHDFTTIIRDEAGKITCFEGYLLDNTLRKQSELTLAYNRRLEHLVSTLAHQFISLSSRQIDEMIDKALQTIGEFVQADRSYIFQYFDELRFMNNTHEWCAGGIEPQIGMLQNLPTADFEWSTKKIAAGEVIIAPKVSAMPDQAASEREILEAQDIKSVILIPLVSDSKPFGFIGFDAVRKERQWPASAAAILSLAGGIIANALQRQKAERLIQSEFELALKLSASESFEQTLQHCLKTAITATGMECGSIFVLDDNADRIRRATSEGFSESYLRVTNQYRSGTPEYELMTRANALYSNAAALTGNVKKIVQSEGMKAVAVVPIITRNQLVASLNLASRTFDQVPEFARQALESIASHIGAAIMQSRHEERVGAVSRNLEALFSSIDDMLFILGENGAIVHANTATVSALGYSLAELRRMNVLEVHPVELREQAQQIVEEMLAGEKTVCTIPLLKKAGDTIPVETRITRGLWDGKPVLFGISRNISERLKSQLALIESEKKFRGLTEHLPFPLFETDLRGMVTYINRAGIKFFDVSPEEVQNELSAYSFCWPKNLDPAVASQQKIFDPGYIPRGNEYTVVMKDGRQLPLLLYNNPIRKENKLIGMRTTVVDLTELKRAEAALRESELQNRVGEEFKSIISNIPGLVFHVSNDHRLKLLSTGVQPWTKPLLQSHRIESLDEAMLLVHPEDRQQVLDTFDELQRNQRSATIVFRVVLAEDQIKWIENRSISIFSDDGKFIAIDGILFDMTERVREQQEKKQLEESLIKAQRLETIGTLAGGIAHDFNNILSPILGYAEMGMMKAPENNSLRDYFTNITLAAERAQHLVSQILTFSRSEQTQPVTLRIQPVIEEAMKLLRPTIPSTISIKTVYGKCGNVLADPSQIHQVIMNLCTNAFHAMATSGGELTIELREVSPDAGLRTSHQSLTAGRYARLSITDTGHGMDEATMQRILEPFFTTKPVNKGTGLGLSVTHGIVTSFNGEITIESAPGKGSTFRVYLPVITSESPDRQTNDALLETLPGTRVLFVDDEIAGAEVMRVMLEHLGFVITAMDSPVEALAAFRVDPDAFDLVITDLTMPKMTGLELARKIHALDPQVPVMLMTGYSKEIETTSLSQFGIRKLLKKPVRLAPLAKAIREVMTGKEPQ